ncbi:MAG: YihY/virulence factor BrkB family protein [Cyclobacteriaceae bacterium]|nr:YihY/virulence factor BrkB family protein [Cyclobacteriaceae bacterium]
MDSGTYKRLVLRLDNIRLRNRNVSTYRILENLVRNIFNDDIPYKASSVAFSFTLAVFPAIIFLFTLLPYLPIPNLEDEIRDMMKDFALLEQVNQTIIDVLSKPRGDLLSFSVILSLILSTNGMLQLADTFNKIYRTIDRRSYWYSRLMAMLLTFILAIALLVAVILFTVGNSVIKYMVENGYIEENFIIFLLMVMKFLILFLLFLFVIACIYYFAPALHNKWKFISIGCVVATLLTILVSYFFSYYISNFGTYNKIYGSIGAMIALMFWIYLISITLLIGYEINASIDQAAAQGMKEDGE